MASSDLLVFDLICGLIISDLALCSSVMFSGLCGSELCDIFLFGIAGDGRKIWIF